MSLKKIFNFISGAAVLGTIGLLLWRERRRPLRAEVEPATTHNLRNLAVAAVAGLTIQLTEKPVNDRLTALVESSNFGLLKRLRLPIFLETLLAVVMLDYTLYIWHVLTHKVPLLWRFHRPHHADLDLTTTTALRFHFGELLASVPWRAAQILLIGVSPTSLAIWQTLLIISILFHHSNVKLPIAVERAINRFIVTPRMHGIHHSIVQSETDSNWSSGLTIWDRLHGTLKLDVQQAEITIGLPEYRDPSQLELTKVLTMPFSDQESSGKITGRIRLIDKGEL